MERRISVQAALCAVGCLHLITFTSLLLQSPLLFGQHGLQPITGFLHEAAQQELGAGSSYSWNPWAMLQFHPTLLVFHVLLGLSAEAAFAALCVACAALGFAAACGALHPVVFTALWLLYLSVVSVGQAFLPQPGDAVLLEVTFACIWLSLSMFTDKQQEPAQQQEEVDQDAEHLEKQRQKAAAKEQQAAQHPAALLMRWLLFKLLLLTSSAKALSACVPARGLVECYSVLTAHGQPHSLTWLLQALPAPLAATSAALAMLELPASFAVLLPGPLVQTPVALLLVLQLVRAASGSQVLLHLAAAALCLAVLDDSWLVPVLQRVARGFARGEAAEGDAEGTRPGGLQRADSNVSLASIMSLEELQPTPEAPAAPHHWDSTTMRTLGGLVVLTAALAFGNSAGAGRVLWLTAQQLTSALGVLVPAAAGWWLFTWGKASWQSYTRASAASVAASAALQRKLQAAAEAAARADAAAGMPAAGSAARAKPTANGLASPDPMLSPAASPTPIKAKQLAAATPAADAAGAKHGTSNGPAVEGGAAASATDTEEEGSTPRAGRRRAAAKSTPQPRKGRIAKAAAPAGEAATEGEGEAGTQEDYAAPAAAPARGGKRAAGGRGRKAAAAPAGEATEDEAEAAAAAAAAPAPEAVAVVATTPATAAKASATTPVTAGRAVAARAAAAASRVSLQERLAPQLLVVAAVSVAIVALLIFLAGLPAVLAPAGWSQASLKSAVPALMGSYRTGRTLGIIASSTSLQRAWAATTTAATSGAPGSYLAFELSTSDDGWSWQAVQFRQSGFAMFGSSMVGSAGSVVRQEGLLGKVRGVYEPRLQGLLAAAGSGSLEDNSWLLGLADKVLEGSPDLSPHLVQPVQPHSWAKIDLVRYTPTSLPAMRGASVPGGWVAQHVAEVLPVMPRGDADWKETLLQLGMASSAAAAPRSIVADVAAHVAYPGWLLAALLAAVALRHCLFSGGLVYSLRAEGLNKAAV